MIPNNISDTSVCNVYIAHLPFCPFVYCFNVFNAVINTGSIHWEHQKRSFTHTGVGLDMTAPSNQEPSLAKLFIYFKDFICVFKREIQNHCWLEY